MRTVAHLSDLHFGRSDPAVAEALLVSLEENGPDLVIVSEGAPLDEAKGGAVLRLRPTADQPAAALGSFWRYDRAGLTAELRRHRHSQGA